MVQTENRFFDGMARLFTDAAGAAQAFRSEMESLMKSRLDRLISDLDLVQRDEFEAVKAMAAKARAENEKLAARLAKLETAVALSSAKSARPRAPLRKAPQTKRTKGNL
jgi:BMFP domain-containing protein YqiC